MTTDLAIQRQFFAEEIQAVCNIRNPSLVDALATVRRERFLRPGPWLIRGEGDVGGPPRQTPDASSRHVYHNVSIAIDPDRQLFNGAPSVVATCIDALRLGRENKVLHVGCGLGYYTALMAHCTGPEGRIVAIDVDEQLAAEATTNLEPFTQVEVRSGNGTETGGERFDAILVSAGMTHPREAWLQALEPGGRLVLPLTCTMAALGPTIGKGVILLISATDDGGMLDARPVAMVAIYSAVGLRDAALNERLAKAFMRSPWPSIRRLRTDPHEPSASCWLHGDTFCLASA